MRLPWRRRNGRERGQALPLIGLSMVALCGMTGLAIDVGRLFAARTELTRSLDAGALAGVQELPDLTKAKVIAVDFVKANEPTAINVTAAQDAGDPRRLRVSASKSVAMTFLKLLQVGPVTVTSSAVAGLGTIPMDVVMAIDVTGSMHWDCTNGGSGQTSDCKIKEARKAANALVDTLLTGSFSSGLTTLGLAPFTDCYAPPGPAHSEAGCVPASKIQALTTSNSSLHTKINALAANGGTNVCSGLVMSNSVIFGSGSHTGPDVLRAVVLMSDGGNSWTDSSTDANCRVKANSNPWGYSDVAYSGECQPANAQGPQTAAGGQMDTKTHDYAKTMKQAGVEFYVVAVGVCGPKKPDTCNATKIGVIPDTDRAHNLLECIASSAPGTNDHYFETDDATDLSDIFAQIARLLALRLIE